MSHRELREDYEIDQQEYFDLFEDRREEEREERCSVCGSHFWMHRGRQMCSRCNSSKR